MNELTAKNRFPDTEQTAIVMPGFLRFSQLGQSRRNPRLSIV